jgi:hypothetical protein
MLAPSAPQCSSLDSPPRLTAVRGGPSCFWRSAARLFRAQGRESVNRLLAVTVRSGVFCTAMFGVGQRRAVQSEGVIFITLRFNGVHGRALAQNLAQT